MITDRIDKDILELAAQSDRELEEIYHSIDRISLINSDRILSAFMENNVSYSDFADINGYGNYDAGRDKLEKIFDRFYRSDKARTSGTGGFGLGLAIARETARAHEGDITCASTEADGTTFKVTLPVA